MNNARHKLLALTLTSIPHYWDVHPTQSPNKERPCIQCGTMHDHNNSFCSAKCCRDYKQQEKPEN